MKSLRINNAHSRIATGLRQKLKILRENNNYSQRQVAEFLGVDRSTYAYYELGKTTPSIDVLVALSELYHVSCEFLLGVGIDEKEKFNPTERRILHILRYEDEKTPSERHRFN